MALQVYNTLSRKKEAFVPAHPRIVRIYTCGLTVYAPMHIGHARTYCFWDFFRRYLEYLGYHVLSVVNYTDIDDRIMQKASEQGRGPIDIAEENIAAFRRDLRSLRVKEAAAFTRATDFVGDQVEMTQALLDKGHAYVVDGEVLYDVQSYEQYGALSGQKLEGTESGASGRIAEDAGRKRHPADFTLWKPSGEGQPSWATGRGDWDSGRPGWHLECSVMSSLMLGESFDVHGGAVDNKFPHHENELAQSQPFCQHAWVRYWMHPEHLDFGGEKMSKSLGNVLSVPEILEEYRYDELRWFFASNHYRHKLSYSQELVGQAAEGYRRIRRTVELLEEKLAEATDEELRLPVAGDYYSLRSPGEQAPRMRHEFAHGQFAEVSERLVTQFQAALDDDLNTPEALAALFGYVRDLGSAGLEACTDLPSLVAVYRCLTTHLHVFGIELADARLHPWLAADAQPSGGSEAAAPLAAVFDKMLELRQQARKDKDFAKADAIRDLLTEAGLQVEDGPEGSRWSL
jgi:cysteinyl-tRNA synthetase